MANEDLVPALGLLIPIITVTVSLGALIVWIVAWSRRRVSHLLFRRRAQGGGAKTGIACARWRSDALIEE